MLSAVPLSSLRRVVVRLSPGSKLSGATVREGLVWLLEMHGTNYRLASLDLTHAGWVDCHAVSPLSEALRAEALGVHAG